MSQRLGQIIEALNEATTNVSFNGSGSEIEGVAINRPDFDLISEYLGAACSSQSTSIKAEPTHINGYRVFVSYFARENEICVYTPETANGVRRGCLTEHFNKSYERRHVASQSKTFYFFDISTIKPIKI